MKTALKFALALLILCSVISCGGKQSTGNNEVEITDEALAESKRISDSLTLVYAEKEKERKAAEEKKKLGHNIGDTIPFGNLQIVVLEVEKRKIEDKNSSSRLSSLGVGKKPFGIIMKVSVTNAGDVAQELPFTYFQEEKRQNNNPYYQEQQMPFWAASRFSYSENKKSLIKDFAIKPSKTLTLWYQVTGYGASTTVCFVEKDDTEVDERLEKMVKAKGGEFMSMITEDYNGLLAKVNLADVLQKKTEE